VNNESVVLRTAFALGTNDVEVLVELYVDLVSVLGHLDLVLALLASDEARLPRGSYGCSTAG
jgi:hypothetical protein